MKEQITIDANLVAQELQALLSQAQFQLAVAGARIVQHERTIETMKTALAEATKKEANDS